MITLEQFLVVSLVVLLGVIVACGVVAVILLKRTLDADKEAPDLVQDTGKTDTEQTDALALRGEGNRVERQQLDDLLLDAIKAREEASRAVADAHQDLREAYAAMAELQREALRVQMEETKMASSRISEAFSLYGEVRNREDSDPPESHPSATRGDVEHWFWRHGLRQQSA